MPTVSAGVTSDSHAAAALGLPVSRRIPSVTISATLALSTSNSRKADLSSTNTIRGLGGGAASSAWQSWAAAKGRQKARANDGSQWLGFSGNTLNRVQRMCLP